MEEFILYLYDERYEDIPFHITCVNEFFLFLFTIVKLFVYYLELFDYTQ